MGTYRAAVHLPGLAAGEECEIDPDAAPYLKAWVRGEYLVAVKATAPRRRSRAKKGAGRDG